MEEKTVITEQTKRAYHARIGFFTDWPNFPSAWEQVVEKVKIADEGATRANRRVHRTLIAPAIPTVILPDTASSQERQAAQLQTASPLAYYIGKMGIYYADMLTRHGFGQDVQAVLDGWQRGRKAALEAVSPRLLEETTIVGTPSEMVARLDQWAAAGVDQPLLWLPSGSVEETGVRLSALKAALEG
jgi:alkanesulfonate monooxygenase SsuD/methylene tetrahydromethanopterin reductase-like flavin-dependent oxidoreductase (luciferase family)